MRRLSRDSAKAIIINPAGVSFRHFIIIVRIIHHIRFRALLYSHDCMFGVAAQHNIVFICCVLIWYPRPFGDVRTALQHALCSRFVFIRSSVDLIQMISLRRVLGPPVLA